jgi:hypothetical protein
MADPSTDAPVREPITRFFNKADQIRQGVRDFISRGIDEARADPLQAAINVGRGMVRSVPQMASSIPDTMVKTATAGLIDPNVAGYTSQLLEHTPLATTNTAAEQLGEAVGPPVGLAAKVAPALARAVHAYTPTRPAWFDSWHTGARDPNAVYRLMPGDDAAQRARDVAINIETDRRIARSAMAPRSGFQESRLYEPTFPREPHWTDPFNPFAPGLKYEGGDATTIRAVDTHGGEVGKAQVSPGGYPRPGDPPTIDITGVAPAWQRQHVNTEMYNELEKTVGQIWPSQTLSPEGQRFWLNRNPELLQSRINDSLLQHLQPVIKGDLTPAQAEKYALQTYRTHAGALFHDPSLRPIMQAEIDKSWRHLADNGLVRLNRPPPQLKELNLPGWEESNTGPGMPKPQNTSMKDEAIDYLNREEPQQGTPTGMPLPTRFNPPVNPHLVHKWEDHVMGASEPLTREDRWVAQRLLEEYRRRGVAGIKDNGPVTTPSDETLRRYGNAPVPEWRGMGMPPPLTRQNPNAKFGPVHERDLPEDFGDMMQGEYLHPEVEKTRNDVMWQEHKEYLRRKALFLRLLLAPRE